ncbi:MAG TPA: hypothetical protein VHY83_06625 [Solirubrobacteraceae bacterium]|jgi:hypothetical protein|nr:hypothetical protein [Solirubrobacteraceae bacterium]
MEWERILIALTFAGRGVANLALARRRARAPRGQVAISYTSLAGAAIWTPLALIHA